MMFDLCFVCSSRGSHGVPKLMSFRRRPEPMMEPWASIAPDEIEPTVSFLRLRRFNRLVRSGILPIEQPLEGSQFTFDVKRRLDDECAAWREGLQRRKPTTLPCRAQCYRVMACECLVPCQHGAPSRRVGTVGWQAPCWQAQTVTAPTWELSRMPLHCSCENAVLPRRRGRFCLRCQASTGARGLPLDAWDRPCSTPLQTKLRVQFLSVPPMASSFTLNM
jgi:hypothetical protein